MASITNLPTHYYLKFILGLKDSMLKLLSPLRIASCESYVFVLLGDVGRDQEALQSRLPQLPSHQYQEAFAGLPYHVVVPGSWDPCSHPADT